MHCRLARNPRVVMTVAGVSLLASMACSEALDAGSPPPDDTTTPGPSAGLTLTTYINGTNSGADDQARDVAVDAMGNVFVTGGTADAAFFTTPGAYQSAFGRGLPPTSTGSHGPLDVYVMKFSPTGQLLWSTLLGGPNYDRAYAIEVDATGVYVGGRAGEGFPTTPGAAQPQFSGDNSPLGTYGRQDGFVAKLSLDGSSLLWATYVGGGSGEFLRDIAIDGQSRVYLAVAGVRAGFPHITPSSYQPVHQGGTDGAVCRLAGTGSVMNWCTYIGGSANDGGGPSIRIDGSGAVYFSAAVASTNAPVTPGAAQTQHGGGGRDLFLVKLSSDGSSLLYGTYVGGDGDEDGETHNLWVSASGEAVVTGTTTSNNLPTSPGAIQGSLRGGRDGFVARFSADGRHWLAVSYLGGSGDEGVEGTGMDGQGNIAVTGNTTSADFPTSAGALRRTLAGSADGFVALLSADLRQVLASTYVGGGATDVTRSVVVDSPRGIVYAVGITDSDDLPTTASAFRTTYRGKDAFLMGWTIP
jgi:hypothetical protein